MLNQLVVIGRLVRDPELRKTDSGRNVTNITLAVPRSYKNINGEYDTDYIDCTLWANVAESATEYCHKGDLLGLKGRIQTKKVEDENKVRHVTEVIGENITFLTPNSKKKIAQEKEE